MAQKVDLIAFSPVSDTGWDAVLREAKAAAMPAASFTIFELQGTAGSPAALARSKGFAQAIAAHPRLKVLRSQSAGLSSHGRRQAECGG